LSRCTYILDEESRLQHLNWLLFFIFSRTRANTEIIQVSIYFSITLTEFYFLNPSLDTDCTNLWLATSYCVASVGDVVTYPGYPISSAPPLPYTLTADAFTTESWSTVTPVVIYYPVQTVQPLAPGTLSTCHVYQNGTDPPVFVDQSISENVGDMYDESYSWCNTTALMYGETLDNLLLWNPSLVPGNATGNCTLLPGFRYCAQLEADGKSHHKSCIIGQC
jgi:hypothetical protein